jgi:hypothetical protein
VANVVLLGDSAEVVSAAGTVIAVLKKGDEFNITKMVQVQGRPWAAVTLAPGRTGYLRGDIPVQTVEQMKLAQARAAILERPEGGSPVTATLEQGALFWVLDKVRGTTTGWLRVRNEHGTIGYLDDRTRVVKASTTSQSLSAAVGGLVAGLVLGSVWAFNPPQTWRMVAFAITFMPLLGIKPLLRKVIAILAYLAGTVGVAAIAALLLRH